MGGVLIVTCMSLLGIGVELVWPLASGYLIDDVIQNKTLSFADKAKWLAGVGVGMALLFLASSCLGWVRNVKIQLYNSKLAFRLRSKLFERILYLPLGELSEMKSGGILSRLSTDVDNTTGLLQSALLTPGLATLRFVFTLAIIFTLDYRIASALILALPPILLLQMTWARKIRPIWRSMGEDRQEIDARVNEGINGIRVVRAFRGERREQLKYAVGHHTVIRKQILAQNAQRAIGTIWELVMPVTQVTIVCYGGYLVVQGQTTLGTLVAFQGYLWRLLEPILSIANSISETQRGLAAMERIFDVFDKPPEKPDVDGAIDAPTDVQHVRFENVSFAYRPGMPVIEGFNLEVPGGTVVALTGPSGAGKTTLTDLVARFHDPTAGALTVNGIDLRKFKLESYRRLLGIVSQEVFLFDGTVRDNIAYARPNASLAEVRHAAERAHAHEFISDLPENYNTLIGERGVKLSGGQRQRLSIARALLADPKILIMDEATSNLDTESEQLIQASMQELLRGRTTFVIAHRLSTIIHADRIIVVDRGRIVEQGTHPELMTLRGAYYEMVQRQREDTRSLRSRDLVAPPSDPAHHHPEAPHFVRETPHLVNESAPRSEPLKKLGTTGVN
jgi:ATP-binding cassette subfamily B protein/subfamily B ATP-binding cassette protein MsbA